MAPASNGPVQQARSSLASRRQFHAGWDVRLVPRRPTPAQLLQQVALGMVAVADRSVALHREVVIDILEEAFYYVSAPHEASAYEPTFTQLGLDMKELQFAIMQMLCCIYREVCASELPVGSGNPFYYYWYSLR